MFHAEKMTAKDFPFAVKLANTMDWNMAKEDFELAVKLEPEGCFVLSHGSQRSGIATSISFGKIGWFGNLIVKKECRREGGGSFLVTHALNYLKAKGVETTGLYAYPHLTGFYRRFGFELGEEFVALKGKACSSAASKALREAKKEDFQEIINFDSKCFGASRERLFQSVFIDADSLCYVATHGNKIKGYVAAKVYGGTADVGPLACPANRSDVAFSLLKTILCRLEGSTVSMCVPSKEVALLDALSKEGFHANFRVSSMFLGPRLAENCIYMAESLERG